jgi:putative ABC transport system permease protein
VNPTEYVYIAIDSLFQNMVRSILTMLGVIIGVMSVILLVALGEGAQAYIEKEFAGLGSNLILITPGKQETTGLVPVVAGSFRKLTYTDAKEVKRRAKGVREVSPVVMGAGFVKYSAGQRDVMVFGITPAFEEVRDLQVRIGRFITTNDIEKNRRVCVLGKAVRDDLFGSSNPLNEKVSINRQKHMVVGIMETKGVTLGINIDDIVIVPLTSGQQMFHGGEDVLFNMVIQANSPNDIETAKESVSEILYAAHDYSSDFTVTDQTSMLDTLDSIFTALKIMLVSIASISLVVGGIGIMNIMLVSVRERTREVGVRKAVGADKWDIAFQFVIESITLSCIGGLIGITLGYVGTYCLRTFYPSFPIFASTWSILMAFFFSVAVGVFFGVYPAVKAASVDPVEALRYE